MLGRVDSENHFLYLHLHVGGLFAETNEVSNNEESCLLLFECCFADDLFDVEEG